MSYSGTLTILLLDDSRAIRQLLRRTPETRPYRVIEASSANQAWALLAVERPALVLMEMRLAGPDPLEICRTLRRDERLPQTRILVLTTMAGDEGRRRALEAGADEVMAKPFHPAQLVASVDRLVRAGDDLHRQRA